MKVTFAPDWRGGVPYQRLLAQHLADCGVEVSFLGNYHRGFPLYRGMKRQQSDLLHLHWPEAYWPTRGNALDFFRLRRYPLDLRMAARLSPLVYTAHNLWPHNVAPSSGIRRTVSATLKTARAIFVHSQGALDEMRRDFDVDPAKCVLIPHGDLSADLGNPVPRNEARATLNLDSRPVVLMFGRIEPYKGIEPVMAWWKQHRPEARLFIVGELGVAGYDRVLAPLAGSCENIQITFRRLNDSELNLWLSAVDGVLFNYRRIFTSGAASLARSWGVPVLLPSHLKTVELGEPSPYVVRFHSLEENFSSTLDSALSQPSNFAAAQGWRDHISWPGIARKTTETYRKILLD